MQIDPYSQLLQYSLKLIAGKRYTKTEIHKKLCAKKTGSKQDVDQVVKRLLELKYINDTDYAKDYISTRNALNPRGKWLLKYELKNKGIDETIINNSIEAADIDEEKLAGMIVAKKSKSLDKYPAQKKKEKIMMLLASRGFMPETIYKILSGW